MKYGRYIMHSLHNESFNNLSNAVANLGDSVQALAIDSIYSQIGIKKEDVRYVERDFPERYNSEPVDIVFYSEFAKQNLSKRIDFSDKINIKSIVSAVFYDEVETLEQEKKGFTEFLKTLGPIGARDDESKEILKKSGFETYLTGCFTVCFPKRTEEPKTKKVFFVDTPKELEQHIPSELREYGEYLSHAVQMKKYPVDFEENERLEKETGELLRRYREEATLVVTGRLHVAVPCLAMGIPVILSVNNLDFRFGWVEKLIRPYQLGEYESINWNPEPIYMEDLKKVMLTYFKKALAGEDFRAELQWLDNYYSNREKVKPYKIFREIVSGVKASLPEGQEFKYMIWGAGFHCGYAYQIISELIPNSKLVAVVDKFKTGEFKGVPIIRSGQIDTTEINHMFITTVPGKEEAITWRNENMPQLSYSLILSQHKS